MGEKGPGPLLAGARRVPSAHRRPGYPLVGLRPRRARLRFTRRVNSTPKRLRGTSSIGEAIGKSNCRRSRFRAEADREF
jgi:hypothetical protein